MASGDFAEVGAPQGDSFDDIIVAPDAGGSSWVKAFSSATGAINNRVFNPVGIESRLLFSFFAYPGFFGGVRVAAGDVTGDGTDDLVTAAGAGGGPHVQVFNGRTRSTTAVRSFFAYDSRFTGGVYVAVGNIDNSTGAAEIITGAGAGGGPHVKVFNVQSNVVTISQFFAYDPGFTGGVRVATGDVNGDTFPDIITGPGQSGGPRVRVFNGPVVAANNFASPSFVLKDLYPYEPNFFGGVFVAGVRGELTQTQRAATVGTAGSQTPDLTQDEVDAAVDEALNRFQAAGVPEADIDYLRTVHISVGDLSGDLVGYSTTRGIVLDVNAAGNGWFIDPTLGQDEEFAPSGAGLLTAVNPAAMNRMDLLTVVMHELGHKLGLDDIHSQLHPDALMNDTLSTGTRRLPTSKELDEAFADDSLFDSLLLD